MSMIVSASSGSRHKTQLATCRIILQSNTLQRQNYRWRQLRCAEYVSTWRSQNPQCRIISSSVEQRRIFPKGKLLWT